MRIGAYWSVLSVFKRIGAYSCLFLHCNNMQEYPRIRKNMREYARIRSIHSNVHKNTQQYASIRMNKREYARIRSIHSNTLEYTQYTPMCTSKQENERICLNTIEYA